MRTRPGSEAWAMAKLRELGGASAEAAFRRRVRALIAAVEAAPAPAIRRRPAGAKVRPLAAPVLRLVSRDEGERR